jgi:hypothetical protein
MGADFVSIPVVVTRGLWLAGKQHAIGEVLRLTPGEAAAAVASGRARLEDPADRARCDAALKSENDRVFALCGRVPQDLLRFGGRW